MFKRAICILFTFPFFSSSIEAIPPSKSKTIEVLTVKPLPIVPEIPTLDLKNDYNVAYFKSDTVYKNYDSFTLFQEGVGYEFLADTGNLRSISKKNDTSLYTWTFQYDDKSKTNFLQSAIQIGVDYAPDPQTTSFSWSYVSGDPIKGLSQYYFSDSQMGKIISETLFSDINLDTKFLTTFVFQEMMPPHGFIEVDGSSFKLTRESLPNELLKELQSKLVYSENIQATSLK
jgi:hypothetical protein